jgi:hypothetical protein
VVSTTGTNSNTPIFHNQETFSIPIIFYDGTFLSLLFLHYVQDSRAGLKKSLETSIGLSI